MLDETRIEATCVDCRETIVYRGGGWRHRGPDVVKHPAIPAPADPAIDPNPLAAADAEWSRASGEVARAIEERRDRDWLLGMARERRALPGMERACRAYLQAGGVPRMAWRCLRVARLALNVGEVETAEAWARLGMGEQPGPREREGLEGVARECGRIRGAMGEGTP